MKKLTMGIAVVASVLVLGTTSAFAAGNFYRQNFVDQNMDGVCDNYTNTGKGNGTNFVDANGDGVCDNYTGTGKGNGTNFVDADGDGVCDNQVRPQNGTGKQFGKNR